MGGPWWALPPPAPMSDSTTTRTHHMPETATAVCHERHAAVCGHPLHDRTHERGDIDVDQIVTHQSALLDLVLDKCVPWIHPRLVDDLDIVEGAVRHLKRQCVFDSSHDLRLRRDDALKRQWREGI